MPDLKKLITLEALQAALPSWLKSSSKPSYTADEISDTNTTNKFVTSTEKSTWNAKGTYSKPTGGIPKSDLSQLVQNSLDLADSALQSESDPTVPSWAKQTNKPSYTQDEVTDGTTYKRVTQTEKNAWSGKQNALTTTQMNAVNSGINSTKVGQISTNQTNILYALGKTGRNHFDLDMSVVKNWNTGGTWNGNVYTQGGLTFTFNSDGTIDVSGTATERVSVVLDVYYPLNTKIGYRFHDLDGLVLSGCPTGGAWNKYSLSLQMTDSPWTSAAIDTGSGATINNSALPATTAFVAFYLTIYASYPTSSFTFKPMFCTQEDWSIAHDYTPYRGAPNSDLTQLEAEDRAELIDLVDSGAKQLLQFNNDTSGQLVATVQSDGYTVKVTGGESTGKKVTYATASISKTGLYALKVDLSGTGASCYLYDATTSTQIKEFYASTEEYFTLTAGHTYNIKTYRAGTGTNATIALLLCTKAAFGVSNKFVPYRPSWDLIYSSLQCDVKYAKAPVSTSYSLIGSIKTKANRVCRVTVTQEYAAVAPTGLILSKSNQSSDFNTLTNRIAPPVETTTDDITLTISTLCYFTYDRVIYIWAKAKTASTNGNNFMALCEHFGDIDGVKNSMT